MANAETGEATREGAQFGLGRAPFDVAMMHFAPLAGYMEHNFGLIELAARQAAESGASLLLTPELALSGYDFVRAIGTSWIASDIPVWRERFAELAPARHRSSGQYA